MALAPNNRDITEFCLYLSSTDSKHIYQNDITKFTCEMPGTLYLPHSSSQQWSMALTDIVLLEENVGINAVIPESITVLCSLAEPSVIHNTLRPVLRQLFSTKDGLQLSLFQAQYKPS